MRPESNMGTISAHALLYHTEPIVGLLVVHRNDFILEHTDKILSLDFVFGLSSERIVGGVNEEGVLAVLGKLRDPTVRYGQVNRSVHGAIRN